MDMIMTGKTIINNYDKLLHHCRALAIADTILMPEWEYRYFSFNRFWSYNPCEMLASMRDGEGEEYFILFNEQGAAGKVFNGVPSTLHNENYLEKMPACFKSFMNEPAFCVENYSYFFWIMKNFKDSFVPLRRDDNNYGPGEFLANDFRFYHQWAQNYYDRDIDLDSIESIFIPHTLDPHMPHTINKSVLNKLNHEISLDDIYDDLNEIVDMSTYNLM